MLQNVINIIINKQVESRTILEDEVNIYRYGYLLMFEVIINVIISVLIGIFFDDLKTVIFFLIMYIPLRSYAGGWHANKIYKCTIVSSLILVVAEILVIHISNIYALYFVPILVVCIAAIILVAPVDTESKPLSQMEKKICKKKMYGIIATQICVLVYMSRITYEKYIIIIGYVYVVQALMLLIEKIKQKKKV